MNERTMAWALLLSWPNRMGWSAESPFLIQTLVWLHLAAMLCLVQCSSCTGYSIPACIATQNCGQFLQSLAPVASPTCAAHVIRQVVKLLFSKTMLTDTSAQAKSVSMNLAQDCCQGPQHEVYDLNISKIPLQARYWSANKL